MMFRLSIAGGSKQRRQDEQGRALFKEPHSKQLIKRISQDTPTQTNRGRIPRQEVNLMKIMNVKTIGHSF